MELAAARRVVALYAEWPVVETTAQLTVVEAALLSGATTLLTEDLQDGRRVGGLTIRNPFRPPDPT